MVFARDLNRYIRGDKMRMVSKSENEEGKTIIETESKILFFKKTRRFVAVERVAGEYFNWLELPHYLSVPDALSFQLDAWKRI